MSDGAAPESSTMPIVRKMGEDQPGKPAQRYLVPQTATIDGPPNEKIQGPGIIHKPERTGDTAVLGVPIDPTILDRFVPIENIRSLYHLVHIQKWEGVVVPHDTHTQAAETNSPTPEQQPYRELVQAVTFAKVTGEMEHPTQRNPDTNEPLAVPCAVLNLRMPGTPLGGQIWWVIGGHNVAHESGSSSLGKTLVKEAEEEAVVVKNDESVEPFNPRQKGEGRHMQVLGYGRGTPRGDTESNARIAKVHESTIVSVHLPPGERLAVSDLHESLGFVRVPLVEWLRFMDGKATEADQDVVRRSIIRDVTEELSRIPEEERDYREKLINDELTDFFGVNRDEFHITPEGNTPPIDRLSLEAARHLYQQWFPTVERHTDFTS